MLLGRNRANFWYQTLILKTFSVRGFPSFYFFKDKKNVEMFAGADLGRLLAIIEKIEN